MVASSEYFVYDICLYKHTYLHLTNQVHSLAIEEKFLNELVANYKISPVAINC